MDLYGSGVRTGTLCRRVTRTGLSLSRIQRRFRVYLNCFLSPLRGYFIFQFTHGLRRGLHSFATSRLFVSADHRRRS